ncbi:hypothetical protein [Parapedobacter sp. DT-150]|uniref:hypothetical protein n=1 Tax=Parapedobacter sp. DT-150 TaxID=3396162 RepID=UPI003F195CBB
MRESILEKISELVAKGIKSEAECVYLLAQTRKYMEQQGMPGYWNLRMCANWTLHSQLDNPTVQGFLRELNDFLIDAEAQSRYNIDRHPSLKSKLSFVASLQDELSEFLNTVGIDSTICTDYSAFRSLLGIFGQVIEDTPLLCKANSPLSHLSEVTFARRKSIFQKDIYPISLYWKIKNGDKAILLIKSDIRSVPLGPFEVITKTFTIVTNDNEL